MVHMHGEGGPRQTESPGREARRGLEGGILRSWPTVSPASENLGLRMGPWLPPASRTPGACRAEGAGRFPVQRCARAEGTPEPPRERARAWGPGRQSRRDGRLGPAGTTHWGPEDARGWEKPLPFHFLPGGGRNEVLGLRWGCSALWRPRCRLPVPGARIGMCVPQRPRAHRADGGGRPPPHPDSVSSGLLRFLARGPGAVAPAGRLDGLGCAMPAG